MTAAKAIVAILGSTITAALGLIPAHSSTWTVLTIIAAALTAAAVYLTPNVPVQPVPPAGGAF